MKPQGVGYDFLEEFADLIELNGYRIVKTARSEGGEAEIIATRADEVGHEITYVIHCKKSNGPVGETNIERIARTQESRPGSITVVVSPSSGFAGSAVNAAERWGVRLWGPGEVERLRRNVAEKRSLRQREAVERSNFLGNGKKRRSKAKFVAILLLLSIAILYVKLFGFEIDPIQKLLIDLKDLVDDSGLRDLNLGEIYKSRAPMVREFVEGLSEKILADSGS